MGEGTASLNRSYAVGTDTFLAMAALYQGRRLLLVIYVYFLWCLICLSMLRELCSFFVFVFKDKC